MRRKTIHSTFILLIGGFITKILGMLIKIKMSQKIGLEGLSTYMMILPSFSLFITIAQAGVPFSLSRFVASTSHSVKNTYYSIIFVLLLFDFSLLLFLFFFASWISENLLHNSSLYYPLLSIGMVLPFTTLSSIFRSYFIGHENMIPPTLSNIFENGIRLLFVLFGLTFFKNYSISFIVSILILFNIISEGISILILLFFMPKSLSFHFESKNLSSILKMSFPNITSSLIGNLTYFLEPILLTSLLLSQGLSHSFIQEQYGIITGYSFSLFFLPSFFTLSFSQSILSFLTKLYQNHDTRRFKRSLFSFFIVIFIFSICLSFFFFFFGRGLLHFIYHTNHGYSYLKMILPCSFFYYSDSLFTYSFLAMGKTKEILYTSLFRSFVRMTSLLFFLSLGFGFMGFLYSFSCNVILTFFFQIYRLFRQLKTSTSY